MTDEEYKEHLRETYLLWHRTWLARKMNGIMRLRYDHFRKKWIIISKR